MAWEATVQAAFAQNISAPTIEPRSGFMGLAFFGCALLASIPAAAQTAQIPTENRAWVTLGAGQAAAYDGSRLASRYLGYAVLSGRSYDTAVTGPGGRLQLHSSVQPQDEALLPKALRSSTRVAVGGQIWNLTHAKEGRQCPADNPNCGAWGGLGVQFWKRRASRAKGYCSEVVIAFRGTQGVAGSAFSNLNPISVFVKVLVPGIGADHYEQVRVNIDNWVKEVRDLGCRNARFVAVGHSLGGGLARHAAYQNSYISKVVTFNTSPVSAWSSVDRERRERNVRGLEIENVVESGEILGALRAPAIAYGGSTSCDPQERTIAFNALHNNPFGQHRIWPLAQKLHDWGARRGGRIADAALPQLSAAQKAQLNCLTEPREQYLARTDPQRRAVPVVGPTVTVRPFQARPPGQQ
jgi:pimeloyl-ACP methyl ester carboxylesterase